MNDVAKFECGVPERSEVHATPDAVIRMAITGMAVSEALATAAHAASPSPGDVALTETQAARFLAQATVGYNRQDIDRMVSQKLSINAWLTQQFATPRGQTFWQYLESMGYDGGSPQAGIDAMIWSQLISGEDALRQRIGYALLNQWVVSTQGLSGHLSYMLAAYLDGIWNYAFGNYRDIMEAITSAPAMGGYLSVLKNFKADPKTGSIPDENFARELLQLFTIGLHMLNMDGTPVLSGGQPIPTYTQNDISQHARVWTGYWYVNPAVPTFKEMGLPMVVKPKLHEFGASQFLPAPYTINIPAGTAPELARKMTLDGLFYHPNVPPFVCRQLIQHLVTSNPSPGYVSRVAHVFANNGRGVRGDMQAVIRAIFSDAEARDDSAATASRSFGKLREPVLRLTHWARAFAVRSPSNQWRFGNLSSSATGIGQMPCRAPSVFNWFRPGYTPPGTEIASAGLVAPTFQITNECQMIAYINTMQAFIVYGAGDARADYTRYIAMAGNATVLVAELNLVLAANQIGASTLRRIAGVIDAMSAKNQAALFTRVTTAITLMMASPEFLVIR